MVVEKGERFAGFEGFEPESDFAQLDGHGVDVHAVKAVADDIAQGGAVNGGAGFFLAAAHAGEMPRNAVAGANDEVARASGHVANFEAQQRGFLFLRRFRLGQALGDDGFERGVEQALDEGIGRVIAATGLAFVAGGNVEFKAAGVGVDARVHFQQSLIDAAEFFRAEILVVHRPPDVVVLDECERVNGFEEVAIGNEAVEQVGRGLRRRPQEAAQGREREFRATGVTAKLGGDELKDLPEVRMRRARPVEGERTQTGDGVKLAIAAAGLDASFGVVHQMQKVAVFGDQQKQQTVDDAQNLLVKFLRAQPTGAEFFEQNSVGAIGDESRPQNGDGLFDSGIKVVEGAEGFILGRFFPAFEPVLLRLFALRIGTGGRRATGRRTRNKGRHRTWPEGRTRRRPDG